MELKPIRNEKDYEAALQAVSPWFDHEPDAGIPEADRFEILLMLIEKYEAEHYPVLPPDPIEAIRFRMEQSGLTVKDMEPYIGKSNQVYEVLSGKRQLTLPMIRRLTRDWESRRKALSVKVRIPCRSYLPNEVACTLSEK